MPRAYSADLRDRVLDALAAGDATQAEIARRFRVSDTTVSSWRKQDREEGRRRPKEHGGGVAMLNGDLAVLDELAAESNDLTLAEYAEALKERTGRLHSPPAVCRALQRLGWRRKKKPSTPANRSAKTWRRRATLGAPNIPDVFART